jgi:hypothetical protein
VRLPLYGAGPRKEVCGRGRQRLTPDASKGTSKKGRFSGPFFVGILEADLYNLY